MRYTIRSTNPQSKSPTLETSENIIVMAKRGRKPRPIVEFPEPLVSTWIEPDSFDAALALHMRRHGDTCQHLHKASFGWESVSTAKPFRFGQGD